MNGRYIVIEGNDGTGKSTQVELLAEYFREQSQEVCVVEEPGSDDPEKTTQVASYLRKVIKDGSLERAPEVNLALFSAARRELWQQKIAPALGCGAVVLSARNYFSTLAYQGYGEGMDLAEIVRVTELFTDPRYMNPDATIILDMNDETERARRLEQRGQPEAPDSFELRSSDFQDRVNRAYRTVAQQNSLPIVNCIMYDGYRKTISEIQEEIRKILI